MTKILYASLLLGMALLLLLSCGGPQQPTIGTPGQVSLVFFYTEA